MNEVLGQIADSGYLGLLVFLRLFGIALMLPMVAGCRTNLILRAVLCVGLTFLVTPMAQTWTPQAAETGAASEPFLVAARELTIGLILGAALKILLLGVQVAGQLVSQMSGVSLGQVYDAAGGASGNSVTKFLDFLVMAIFLLIGGHRLVIGAILNTFQDWPPGTMRFGMGTADVLAELLSQSFLLGVQAAMPILATLVVSNFMAGILGRLMPQVNVLLLSTASNSLLLFASLLIGVGTIAWTLQGNLTPLIKTMVRICGGA